MAMKQIMLDLEFLDMRETGAILSIGAVFMDLENGKLGDEFYRAIDTDDSIRRYGMTTSAETVYWWMQQDKKAVEAAFNDPNRIMLDIALIQLINFLSACPMDSLAVYACGRMDCAILSYAFQRIGKKAPWHHYMERDYRTLRELFPTTGPASTTPHHALEDAKWQALHLIEIFKGVRNQPVNTPRVQTIKAVAVNSVKKGELVALAEDDEL